MKFFDAPVFFLPSLPSTGASGVEWDSQAFQKWMEDEGRLHQIRLKGAEALRRVRQQRQAWRAAHARRCEAHLQELESSVDEALKTAKAEAIAAMVQWHCQTQRLEAEAYQKLLQRAKSDLEAMLSQLFTKLPWGTLLNEALQTTLLSQAHDTIGAIHFHPKHETELQGALAAYPNLHLLPSESLPQGCARLETEYFTLFIEVPQQLEALKEAFLKASPPMPDDPSSPMPPSKASETEEGGQAHG